MIVIITLAKRQYEISDAYIVRLTFIIIFWVTKIVKQVIEKRSAEKQQNSIQQKKRFKYLTLVAGI